LVPAALTNDQRGAGIFRIYGQAVDIGSIEVQPDPAAIATSSNVTLAGATSHTITVTYSDNHGISTTSIIGNNNALRVRGPGGFDAPATFLSIDSPTDGAPRTATYSFTPPGGSWNSPDSGTYTIAMQAGQVADVDGSFVPAGGL